MKILSIYDDEGNEKTRIEFERSDNVAAVKRKIRKAIYENEVKMVLYNADEPLDNNQYLPDGIMSLKYKKIHEKTNDIIITVARNILQIPEYIQIGIDECIRELKGIIMEVSKIDKMIAIFDVNGEELEDDFIIKHCELFNDSEIKICLKKDCKLLLEITNLLPIEASFKINCEISDTISTVKGKILEILRLDNTGNITLFSDLTMLEDDKRLIDYSVQNNDLLFYIKSDSKDEITNLELIKTGKYAKVFKGIYSPKNSNDNNNGLPSNIVLKKYSLKWKKIRNFQLLKDELITLMKLKNEEHPGFVNLVCMFQTESHFSIGMEFMEGGSLDAHIPLKECQIIEYSKQILEALDYLHSKGIIYRNMKCSSILLDLNKTNVKLCNFHLSKFLNDFKTHSIIESVLGSKPADYNWVAPEVINGDRYDTKADIWSFGATLIEMLIGKPPYSNMSPYDVRVTIVKEKSIAYDKFRNPSIKVDNIIGLCLNPDPIRRPLASDLQKLFEIESA